VSTRFQAASYFRKPAPALLPAPLWNWLCRRFYTVDGNGDEQLVEPPGWLPYRAWRFLSKGCFSIDLYKHRTFQQAAPRDLREVVAVAPEAWLMFGTLLGCARDGHIIPWDRDVDIGFPSEQMTDELLDRFRAAGFSVERVWRYELPAYREYVPDAMGQVSKVVLRKGAKIELYCFVRGRDGRLYYGQGRPQLFVIDHDLVFPQVKARFCGFEVNVPARTDENLVYMYGKDWRTPKPRYIRSAEHSARQRHFFIDLSGQRAS